MSELVRKVEDQILKIKNKNLIRKHQRNKDNWAKNKNKKSLQQVKLYINSKEKKIHVNSIKTTKDSKNACKFNYVIDKVAQEKIFHNS